MSQFKRERKLIIMYIDCNDSELHEMQEDLFYALGCVTHYRFVILNKRFEALSKSDLEGLLKKASEEVTCKFASQ